MSSFLAIKFIAGRKLRFFAILVACLLFTGQNPASATVQNILLDDSKSQPNSLSCTGVSIPITYVLRKPLASGDILKVNIYRKGVFEQTIKLLGGNNGLIKNMSYGGRAWYGTSAGNPTAHEWYILPISSSPSEACAQFKSDISFAKNKYTAYKSLVAVFVLKS